MPHHRKIVKLVSLAALLTWNLPAENLVRVCASGCDYALISQAIAAVPEGTTLELAAGETFRGPLQLIRQRNLIIRSSRWRELPPAGHRIDPVKHAPLLASIVATSEAPAVLIGPTENAIALNGVDVLDDSIRFDFAPAASSPSNGTALVCRAALESLTAMPQPLVRGQKYFVRDYTPSTRRGRLAEVPDGPPLDLLTVGSAGDPSYYGRPACAFWEQPGQLTFEGIRFETTAGVLTRNLVQVGNNTETDPVGMGPKGIAFRHSVITGNPDYDGPLFCLALFGGHDLSVLDSWIGHCKQMAGFESKAISIQNVVGAVIRNNYISAASINLLTGGGDSASGEVNRDLIITGNFFEKQGYMMYKEGAGAPTGSCYFGGGSGAYYRRTDVIPNTCANEACYTCQPNKTWMVDTQAVYRRANYLTKNLLEFKDCENCRVEGNYFSGSYAGPDGGQGWCFGISVGVSAPGFGFGSGYHKAKSVSFRNNWADHCYSGVVMTNSAYNATFNQIPLEDITVENNLFSNFGAFPELSQWPNPIVQRFALKQSSGIQGFRFTHNTFRGAASEFGLLLFKSAHQPDDVRDAVFEDNIVRFNNYSFFLDNSASDCASSGVFRFFANDGSKRFRNNVFYGGAPGFLANSNCASTIAERTSFVPTEEAVGFAGVDDHRLAPTSLFSAENSQATQLSTDGSSAGADIEQIEQYAIPARLGVPPMPELLQLKVIPGSRAAVIRFRRPPDVASCRVTLYNSMARTTAYQDADTNSEERQLDSRPTSVIRGEAVQFALGTVSPLNPEAWYSYGVDCGSIRAVGRFRTFAAIPVETVIERNFTHATANAVQLEYSDNSDFSGAALLPLVLMDSGSARVSFILPAGLKYWRARYLNAAEETIETGSIYVSVSP